MNSKVQTYCKLLVDNKLAIEDEFKWQGAVTNVMLANIFSAAGKTCDVQELRAAEELIKENTSLFSGFRGYAGDFLSAVLAYSGDKQGKFEDVKKIYTWLKKDKLLSSQDLLIAATVLGMGQKQDEVEKIIARSKNIYEKMKGKHAFLTSDDDITYAIILGKTDNDIDVLIHEMEECFKRLKPLSFSGNAVQMLSQILAIDDERTYIKCAKVGELYSQLRERGRKYGKGYELAVLGALSLLGDDMDELIDEIILADEYLRDKRGFGKFGIGEVQRLMYAAFAVLHAHMPEIFEEGTLEASAKSFALICTITVAGLASSN